MEMVYSAAYFADRLRINTTSVAVSFSVSFFPNAGISPLTPFKMVDFIRSPLFVTLWRSGPSSPVASTPWQCAQLSANNFAPAAAFGSLVALLWPPDLLEAMEILD